MGMLKAGEIRMWWAGRVVVGYWPGRTWFVRLGCLLVDCKHDAEPKLFSERGGLRRFRRIPLTPWRVHVRID